MTLFYTGSNVVVHKRTHWKSPAVVNQVAYKHDGLLVLSHNIRHPLTATQTGFQINSNRPLVPLVKMDHTCVVNHERHKSQFRRSHLELTTQLQPTSIQLLVSPEWDLGECRCCHRPPSDRKWMIKQTKMDSRPHTLEWSTPACSFRRSRSDSISSTTEGRTTHDDTHYEPSNCTKGRPPSKPMRAPSAASRRLRRRSISLRHIQSSVILVASVSIAVDITTPSVSISVIIRSSALVSGSPRPSRVWPDGCCTPVCNKQWKVWRTLIFNVIHEIQRLLTAKFL